MVERIYEQEVMGEGGEIKKWSRKAVIDAPRNENFVMLFNDKVAEFYGLNSQQKSVLTEMSLHMDEDNVVRVSGADRKAWAAKIGISVQSFNTALWKLMTAKVVIREDNAQYLIDPRIYSKANYHKRMLSRDKFLMKSVHLVDPESGTSTRVGIETEDAP